MSPTAEMALEFGHYSTHGYKVEKFGNIGWLLLDPEGASLLIADHGGVSPTKRDAEIEAYRRIAQDRALVG